MTTAVLERVKAAEAEGERLQDEIAQVCGVLNAATGRLVGLIAQVLETERWQCWGINSPEQWVAWRCGVSPSRARRLVGMARRLPELAATRAALEAGELSEDQVGVVCRHTPASADAEVAVFAREASVSQLARTLGRYAWATEPTEPQDPPETETEAHPAPDPSAPTRAVSFGFGEEGGWRIWGQLDSVEGAAVEAALTATRRRLIDDGEAEPTWADALVALGEGALAGAAAARPWGERHTVMLHLEAGEVTNAHLHLGPAVPDALGRHLCCDARLRPVWEREGVALSVGRALRIVPDRTRVAVEDRDGGCRTPGCERTKWLEVHHIVHWRDGGATDTANLVALCGAHHRAHHRGLLHIEGDADDPHGLVFTDAGGKRLTGCGRPAPPGELRITGNWVHPSGERLDSRWVYFNQPTARRPSPPTTDRSCEAWI